MRNKILKNESTTKSIRLKEIQESNLCRLTRVIDSIITISLKKVKQMNTIKRCFAIFSQTFHFIYCLQNKTLIIFSIND